MPKITLPPEVRNATKPPDNGWSRAQLVKTSENIASNKESMNYFFEFVCLDGPNGQKVNEARSITKFFNGKNLGIAPGSRAFQPKVEEFINMLGSLSKKTRQEILDMEDYEVDKLEGKVCWIKVGAGTDQNGLQQAQIVDFMPEDRKPF